MSTNTLKPTGRLIIAALAGLLGSAPGIAGEADVISAKVRKTAAGVYNFDVTIRSNDKGWKYYCDRFEVLTLNGKLLGSRTLFHPHETEQPFTRNLYIPRSRQDPKIFM